MCARNTHPWETHIPVTPASKRELHMAEFQIRRRNEGWESFGDKLRVLAEKGYPDLTSQAVTSPRSVSSQPLTHAIRQSPS